VVNREKIGGKIPELRHFMEEPSFNTNLKSYELCYGEGSGNFNMRKQLVPICEAILGKEVTSGSVFAPKRARFEKMRHNKRENHPKAPRQPNHIKLSLNSL